MDFPCPLISTKWLRQNIDLPDVKLIDGSWLIDTGATLARQRYLKSHIPGAVFFDIDETSDRQSGLPHMLPDKKSFEKAIGEMGVSPRDRVIVYDQAGIFSAPRVWWMFRAFGHEKVSVLDGGLPKWIGEDGAVTDQQVDHPFRQYVAGSVAHLVADHQMVRNGTADTVIIDARPAARFNGNAAEPRPRLRSGAMPRAKNVPSATVISDDGTLKSLEELREIFRAAMNEKTRAITTCGSGVTAAILCLALEKIGMSDYRLYDGSWAEWGSELNDPELFPVVTPKA